MAYEGMLANAALTAAAGFAHLLVGTAIADRKTGGEGRALVIVAFYALAGVHLLLAGLRQLVAYGGLQSASLAAVEPWVFLATTPPAALVVLPLVYIATFATTGHEQTSRLATVGFAVAISLGLFLVFLEGIEGPYLSGWGSDWTLRSEGARAILLLFMTLPMLGASLLLVRAARRLDGDARRRVGFVGWSFLVYSVAFTLDALGLQGLALLGARVAMAGSALLGHLAYAHAGAPAPPEAPLPAR